MTCRNNFVLSNNLPKDLKYPLVHVSDTNTISLERGPRGEWGPGSARARTKLQFGALDARARTQDPFHSEDPFQRKLCSQLNFICQHSRLNAFKCRTVNCHFEKTILKFQCIQNMIPPTPQERTKRTCSF